MAKPYEPYTGPVITRKQAKSLGLTRFFTGKPCPKEGHLSQRMVSGGSCSTCLSISSEKWQKANPERMKALIADWEDKNREYMAEWRRAYSKAHLPQKAAGKRRRNAERLAAKLAARVPDPSDYTGPVVTRVEARAAGLVRFFIGKPCVKNHMSERTTSNGGCLRCNTELANWLYHQHDEEQQTAWNARNTAWKKGNPEKVRAESHRRRALKRAAEGSHTADELKALLESQRGKCVYCGISIRKGYHVDHLVALARGGTNWISNIQLTCPRCNTSKGARDHFEFAQRLGKLL